MVIWYLLYYRKNVPDYSAAREKNDLGFITFDLQTDILFHSFDLYMYVAYFISLYKLICYCMFALCFQKTAHIAVL
jgi:hypothetical protein